MPRRADFLSAFLRSFAIQGSWNFRTMIGGGMAFALAPLLARIHAGDPVALREALERHAGEFNAHPYLSPVAIGALARIEHDGVPADTIVRFRSALRGPLGALGDQAVWAGWRPFCALSAVILFFLGVGAVGGAIGFLIVYNVGHLGLRAWGFRQGWREGLRVGAALKSAPIWRLARRLVPLNLVLTGVVAGLLAGHLPEAGMDLWVAGVAAIAGLTGYLVPRKTTLPAMIVLFLALVVRTL